MSEAQLSKLVIKYARKQGWLVAHFRPATVRPGRTVTPVTGDGAGFPDLVLTRERIIFVELKTQGRRALRPEQQRWQQRLIGAGAEHYVWNPLDWQQGTIQTVLTDRDSRRWERLLDASRGDRRHAHEVQRLVEGV